MFESLNICTFSFMIPLALTMAGSVRVGISLGAGKPREAKLAAYTALVACVGFMAANALVMLLVRNFIGYLFTQNKEVIDLVASILLVAIAFQVFDGAFTCASGLLRGIGKQHIGAVLNFIGFFVMGMPLQYVFGFTLNLQLLGVWAALALSLFIAALLSVSVIVFFTNWNVEAQKAQERVAAKIHCAEDSKHITGNPIKEEVGK